MKPTVVLLHGLGRTRGSLRSLRRHLERAGYPTWSQTYPSRRGSVATLAADVAERLERELAGRELVAVTHSLGGIVARHVADRVGLRAIVMLAPPNQGSRAARRLGQRALFQRIFGPAGRDVQTPEAWPIPRCPTAIIAGTQGYSLASPPGWVLGPMRIFSKDDTHDGVVSVDETRLKGMAAFATVVANHTWIMNHRQARELVLKFLFEGRF